MYPAATDLRDASSVPALADLDDPTVEGLRAVSIRAVESFCHQSFDSEDAVTRKIRASGGYRLPLPKRLHTLTDLEGAGISLDSGDVFIVEGGAEVAVDRGASMGNWYTQAIRDSPAQFDYGYVDVTGGWGWSDAELPDTDLESFIAVALRLDMEAQAIAQTSTLLTRIVGNQRMGVSDVAEGPLRAFADPGAYPMTVEVQEILRPFVWQPIGIAV